MIGKQEMEEHIQKHTGLLPHQQRVVAEKRELDEKRAKLEAFFNTPTYAALDDIERTLLRSQSTYMLGYSDTLAARITRFYATTAEVTDLGDAIAETKGASPR